MESSICILNPTKHECRGPKRKHINMLMCARHLYEFFGLEMGYNIHETETSHKYVGGMLKPAKGVVFKRNTVIVPTQTFFDDVYRPQDRSLQEIGPTQQYKMNPVIDDLIRSLSVNASETNLDKRYAIEILRCFVGNNVNTGPADIQSVLLRNVITLIVSKKAISESQIRTQSIYRHLSTMLLSINGTLQNVTNIEELSISMQYFLFNCYFSHHVINISELSEEKLSFIDSMMYNAKWIKGIGLVATEEISDPNYLVVNGTSDGNQAFYNAVITTVKKDILQKNTSLNNLPSQYHLSDAFRGGSPNCLY